MKIINGIETVISPDIDDPNIDGGTIDNCIIGGATPVAGSFTTVNASDVVTLEKEVTIKEITTPTPVSGYGKIYTKSDNSLYFQDGAGVEHIAHPIGENYGEAYIYNNSNATVIETADTPIALRQISEGLSNNFTFDAGSTGAITAFADYSGTVAGTVLATSGTHGLSTGEIITIRGTTNYNGVSSVTVVSIDTFYFTDTWVADDGASDWDQGASLTVGTGAAGLYPAFWQMSTAPAAACDLIFMMYVNTTAQTKSTAERKFPINDLGSCSSSCVLDVSDGDIIWLSVQSDGTADITNKHGEFNLRKL